MVHVVFFFKTTLAITCIIIKTNYFLYKSSFKNILSCYIIQSFSSALIQFGHCSSHACQFFSSSHRLFCFVVRCNSCVWHVDIILIYLYIHVCAASMSHIRQHAVLFHTLHQSSTFLRRLAQFFHCPTILKYRSLRGHFSAFSEILAEQQHCLVALTYSSTSSYVLMMPIHLLELPPLLFCRLVQPLLLTCQHRIHVVLRQFLHRAKGH